MDDDPMILVAISRLLTHAGHVVVEAGGALEAVALFREQDFDLALIDYELHTALTGVDVGKHAKRGTALVMLTGYSPQDMRPKIEDPLRGFLTVLGKPVDKDELLRVVGIVEHSKEDTRP